MRRHVHRCRYRFCHTAGVPATCFKHTGVFTSRSLKSSVGHRPYICRTIEKDFLHARYNCWIHMKIDVAIFCFQLQNSLKFQNFWTQQFSPSLLCRDCSRIQIQKTFMIPDRCLLRQVSLQLCPSTRQGMHLAAFLENSTLHRVLNFFLPSRQVSL